MWVSATRTVLRSQRFLPAFLWGSTRAGVDARRREGFVDGYLRASIRGELHTVTVWTDPRAMRDFSTGAVHGELMPRLLRWASEAAYTSWPQDEAQVPDITTVTERLRQRPTFGAIVHPNAAHLDHVIPVAAPGPTIPLRDLVRPGSWTAPAARSRP